MSTRNIVKNIRSNSVGTNGKPKLPSPNQLDYGEIAVNYKEGYETLSLKNDGNKIVSLSVNSVEDVKVNGSGVVENKTANITMKGNTIPVSGGQYSPMQYPSPFNVKAQQIVATDMMDGALKTLETNISSLVTEVLDNEETSAAAIRKLAESAGTVDGSGNIGYQKAAGTHYISNAGSVHNATVILDSEINTLQSTINELETTINNLQEIINQNSTVEWVDLGLSSGLKWAKCNVGAKNETDYGSYFQWGDIMNKTNSKCDWTTYKYCSGSETTLTKYNNKSSYGTVDNIMTLETVDDAAAQIMGGNWRIPTQTEFEELIEGTNNQWVTNYNGTGVNGRKFTSKTDTSKYIFIPAAGYCGGGSVNNVGDNGYVWSSSLLTSGPSGALYLNFHSSGCNVYGYNRCNGLSVRGVRN